MDPFSDSDHHKGYFCYNRIYFMKPNQCAIVTEEGDDVYGRTSAVIAPHGICALWELTNCGYGIKKLSKS